MNIKASFKQIRGDYKQGGLDVSLDPLDTDFSLQEFGGVKIGKAPDKDFKVPNIPKTKDQGNTDFCVSFEGSYTVEQDFGLILSAPFNFATAKRRYQGGNYSGFGLRIEYGLGSLQHDGICLEKLYPFQLNKSRNWMANWRNISSVAWQDAGTRKMKKGYFIVDIYRDKFENFAAALWNWQEFIITGLMWHNGFYRDTKGRLILRKTGGSTGHCVGAIGQEIIDGVRGLWFKNSYEDIPEFWLSEDDVRREMYFGFIVLPFERPIVEIIKKYAGKAVMSDVGDKRDVYLVIKGKKRLIQTELVSWAHNIRLWEDVTKIPDEDLTSIPKGEPIKLEDGESYPIIKEVFSLSDDRFRELKKYLNDQNKS